MLFFSFREWTRIVSNVCTIDTEKSNPFFANTTPAGQGWAKKLYPFSAFLLVVARLMQVIFFLIPPPRSRLGKKNIPGGGIVSATLLYIAGLSLSGQVRTTLYSKADPYVGHNTTQHRTQRMFLCCAAVLRPNHPYVQHNTTRVFDTMTPPLAIFKLSWTDFYEKINLNLKTPIRNVIYFSIISRKTPCR